MSYQVIARQYRPRKFDEVIGQQSVAKILKNAIAADHVAHAYLFAGPRGVGKTTTARILAKALCCENAPTATPCDECDACIAVQNGNDLDAVEIDGASNNGVEQVRQLRENAAYVPSRAKFKLYIIDEAHMLSTAAFNALLKILEEPPPHVKFILVTTEPQKIPETVRSRCQRLDFARISTADMVDALHDICAKEKIDIEPAAVEAIVRNSRGGLRDSQSLLEQLRAFSQDKITADDVHSVLGAVSREAIFDLIDAIADKDAATALSNLDSSVSSGVDVSQFLAQVAEHFRSIMLVKVCGENSPIIDETADAYQQLKGQGKRFELDTVLYASQLVADTRMRVRNNPHSRIEAEMLLVKLCRLEDLMPLGEMVERIEKLEHKLSGGPGPSGVKRTQKDLLDNSGAGSTGAYGQSQQVSVVSKGATDGPAPQPAGHISADINKSWPDLLEAIKKEGTAGAMLTHAEFLGAADGVIRLGFGNDSGSKIARKRVENMTKKIEKLIAGLVGDEWQVRTETLDSEASAKVAARRKQKSTSDDQDTVPDEGSFIDKLVSTFNGIIMNNQR